MRAIWTNQLFGGAPSARTAMLVGCVVTGSLALAAGPAEAQHPVDGMQWMFDTLRPSGQPVFPSFEGWYRNPDGTHELCFGYYNANTEEALEIPLGPDNHVEPPQYDGKQPTHFEPVPLSGYRRHYCVFTVNVPADFGDQEVVWTLRSAGQEFSVPGSIRNVPYLMDEPDAPARAAGWAELLHEHGLEDYSDIPPELLDTFLNHSEGTAQGSVSPIIKFVNPAGPEGRGRTGFTAGPATVRVGQPLTITISAREPNGRPAHWWVKFAKHQGPGGVEFSQQEMETHPTKTNDLATTIATFDEPGSYTLIIQSTETTQSFERHCCHTNAYLQVNVTP